MKKTRFVAVGACAIDTILDVPYFPSEDSKLRATGFTKRRGGNCPNSLGVLQQLVENQARPGGSEFKQPDLNLVAVLPARNCVQTAFITASFENLGGTASDAAATKVDLANCLYREDYDEPVSSYIIASQSNSSRTIVNHNPLPEMTVDEFVKHTSKLLDLDEFISTGIEQIWFHFEGRIPDTTLQCMRFLRKHPSFSPSVGRSHSPIDLTISVELEKAKREGLQALAHEADFVFYSRSWAEGEGHTDAWSCLTHQTSILRRVGTGPAGKTLLCTWGKEGAYAVRLDSDDLSSLENNTSPDDSNDLNQIVHSAAYIASDRPIIDTTGAGDTFIAAVLYKLIFRHDAGEISLVDLEHILNFANGLAGRKILQRGFDGLSQSV